VPAEPHDNSGLRPSGVSTVTNETAEPEPVYRQQSDARDV
jgi:hypothetical protein